MTRRPQDGLTREEQLLVPIVAYIKQLEQQANTLEWEGNLEGCDALLLELQHVREFQLRTGSLYYPLF